MKLSRRITLALFSTCIATSSFAADDWRGLDPENTLVIESSKGRMIIEMHKKPTPQGCLSCKIYAIPSGFCALVR